MFPWVNFWPSYSLASRVLVAVPDIGGLNGKNGRKGDDKKCIYDLLFEIEIAIEYILVCSN